MFEISEAGFHCRERLGLPTRRELPAEVDSRGLEDITRLAFTMIDHLTFPAPPWMLTVDAVDARDLNHATLIADQHRAERDLQGRQGKFRGDFPILRPPDSL